MVCCGGEKIRSSGGGHVNGIGQSILAAVRGCSHPGMALIIGLKS